MTTQNLGFWYDSRGPAGASRPLLSWSGYPGGNRESYGDQDTNSFHNLHRHHRAGPVQTLDREGSSSAGATFLVPQIQLDPEIRPICKTGSGCNCLRGGIRLWYGASVRPQVAASLLFGDGVLVKVPAPARWRTVSSLTACFGMTVAHKQTEIGPRGSGCIC